VIAADTSTWVAFLDGERGADVEALDKSLADRQVVMPPIVLTELLSDPQLPSALARMLADIPRINLADDYWVRAGKLRAKVLAGRRKARLGDALIAQSCLDGGIPLITRDGDFRAFARAAKLNLVFESGSTGA
jgi:predicted nucleic acid-binding protein